MRLGRGPEKASRKWNGGKTMSTTQIGMIMIAVAVIGIGIAVLNLQRIISKIADICTKIISAQEDCYFELRNDMYEVFARIEKLENEKSINVKGIMEDEK